MNLPTIYNIHVLFCCLNNVFGTFVCSSFFAKKNWQKYWQNRNFTFFLNIFISNKVFSYDSKIILFSLNLINSDTKSPKTTSPIVPRRPISIVITPDPPNVQSTFTDVESRSGSISSPRNSNNVDVEDDTAILKKRAQVMNELVETERVYVNDLHCVVEGYMKEYQDGSPELPRELKYTISTGTHFCAR